MLKIIMQTLWEGYAILSTCFITPAALAFVWIAMRDKKKERRRHENY